MAVQDHPRYPEWSEALDRLKEANDCYRSAKGRLDATAVASLLFNLEHCRQQYEKICDEIGRG
jgi:hypothetical protein